MVGVQMGEQDMVDVRRLGVCCRQIGRQPTGLGAQRVATADVDQDVPTIALHEEGDDRGAQVAYGRQECLGQQSADLSGGRAMQVRRPGPARVRRKAP
jgi:hypothetical protein